MQLITASSFAAEVLNFKGKVLVDFWASWCGPCQMLTPVLEEIVPSFPQVKFVKVDVDVDADLSAKYNVASVPTVIIFDHGQVKETIVGSRPRSEYLAVLK